MSSELIYEKKYPNPWEDSDFFTAPDEEVPLHGIPQEPAKFLPRELIENTVQVLMPERMENLPKFLDTAKEIGDQYEIDTTIMESDNRITVSYTLQMDVPYVNLKQILMSADELSVQSQNDKILLTLAYYTCATYFRGRKIAPPDAP